MGSSTGAVKQFRQVFLNLELWSRALGSGLRRRRRRQWRRQGGLPGRRTSRHPPPSPPLSPPSGRRRWRGEWPTSQQLWTWNSSRRTCTPPPTTWAGAALSSTAPRTRPSGKGSDCDLDSQADDALYPGLLLTVQPVKTFKENI